MLKDPSSKYRSFAPIRLSDRTWPDSVEVKIFTSSGITAPASVPHVIMRESFHHRLGSPPRFGISR